MLPVSLVADADAELPEMPELLADPADYRVEDDGSITIQPEETLGHYADWLGIRAADLRRLNGLRYGRPLVVGRRLQLDFSRVDRASFESLRLAFHRELEAYFARRHIVGSVQHAVASGDSLWTLAQQRYHVPTWLIRQYNPDVNFARLSPGDVVVVPRVESGSCSAC